MTGKGRNVRRAIGVFVALILGSAEMVYGLAPARAASGFALPAFEQQWEGGEAITPNFWGPLPTAREGQQEAYREASGGQRTVQYFDKARMEMTNGTLTNGLLTVELMTGNLQTGDATFERRLPARINVAGDPGNDGVTYADLSRLPYKPGRAYLCTASPCTEQEDRGNPIAPLFAAFVDKAGLATVGLPLTSPFVSTITLGGVRQQVWAQAFERRVLTLTKVETPGKPPTYRIEFGNIGQHYSQWRYTPVTTATPSTPTASPTISPAATTTRAAQNGVTSPIRPGVAPASAETCPILYPIKGSTQGGVQRYDLPGSATYPGTKPQICFLAPNDAQVAGYVPVK